MIGIELLVLIGALSTLALLGFKIYDELKEHYK